MSRLRHWLVASGLEQYVGFFAEHCIDFDVLPDLTEQDLEKLQIPLGDRKRLLRAISALEGGDQPVAREDAVPGGLERRQDFGPSWIHCHAARRDPGDPEVV